MEQPEKEVAVKCIKLVLALFLLASVQAIAEIIMVPIKKALALDEIDEHQAIEHDRRIPFAIGHFTDSVNEFQEGFTVCVKITVECLGDTLDVEAARARPPW